MAAFTIDLGKFVNPGAAVLAGRDKGEKARRDLKLADRERAGDHIEVRIPESLITVTMSFLLGLLSDAVRDLTPDVFRRRYQFTGRPDAPRFQEELIAKATRSASPLQPPLSSH